MIGGARAGRVAAVGAVVLFAAACSSSAPEPSVASPTSSVAPEQTATPGSSAQPDTGLRLSDVLEPPDEMTVEDAPDATTTSAPPRTTADDVTMVVDTQCPGLEVLGWFDADGDGVLERIVATGGNTAQYAWLYDATCSPLPGTDESGVGGLVVGASGGGCAPIGCFVAVICDESTGVLVVRMTRPQDPMFRITEIDGVEPVNGVFVVDGESFVLMDVELQVWGWTGDAFGRVEHPIGLQHVAPSSGGPQQGLIGCDR